MRNSVPRAALVLSIAIAIALITGCAAQGGGSAPTGSSPAPSSSPGSADSVGPSDSPRLVDGGTASDNRAYFDRIVTEHIAAECLIGQGDGGAYSSTVAAALGTGGCLPGNTRPIDW